MHAGERRDAGGHVTVEEWAVCGSALPGASVCADRRPRLYRGGTTITQDVLARLR